MDVYETQAHTLEVDRIRRYIDHSFKDNPSYDEFDNNVAEKIARLRGMSKTYKEFQSYHR